MQALVWRAAALAAVGLLVAGTAFAATRGGEVEGSVSVRASDGASAHVEVSAAPLPITAASGGHGKPAEVEADERPPQDGSSKRSGDTEYGYTGPHTAFAQDDELRLELETSDNEATAGAPHTVTVTLSNLTDHEVVLYGPRDCHLAVGAKRMSQEGEDSNEATFVCVESGESPSAQDRETEELTLEPNAKIVHDVELTFDEPGEWGVSAMCVCFDRRKEPRPTPDPADPLAIVEDVLNGEAFEPVHPSRGRNLFTPPIRMHVA